MVDDSVSEFGRLLAGVLFTILVIWLCKVWPSKAMRRERARRKKNG